jgi:hypothetical protein
MLYLLRLLSAARRILVFERSYLLVANKCLIAFSCRFSDLRHRLTREAPVRWGFFLSALSFLAGLYAAFCLKKNMDRRVSFILPFLPRGVFDDDATKRMGEAFDVACKLVNATGQPEKVVREAIARRIIAAARKGERDVRRLRNAALAGPVGIRRY